MPEGGAMLLSSAGDWELLSEEKPLLTPVTDVVPKSRYLRASVEQSPGGYIIRNWTPEGNKPLKLHSQPFQAAPYLSVLITGASRTGGGNIQAYFEHQSNGQRMPVFLGNVNYNLAEALVRVPETWLVGKMRLVVEADEKFHLCGIGSVYSISRLSYLKSTFSGRFAYFVVAFIFFGLILFAGTALAVRVGGREIVPAALILFGLVALVQFYVVNMAYGAGRDLGAGGYVTLWAPLLFVLSGIGLSGRSACARALGHIYPYLRVWFIGGLAYFALLGLAYNGSGHWEPNYRFWPALWSSDNELPGLFAEALFRGWGLVDLYTTGSWTPSDRPPLMTGAHLLPAELFNLLQTHNDGLYLRGVAYNISAIVLNTLWIPIAWWLLERLAAFLTIRQRYLILLLLALTPFSIFNSIYGWPKAFGAAFALVSFGLIWSLRSMEKGLQRSMTIGLFFMAGSLSMLAHASVAFFLIPMGLVFLGYHLRRNVVPVVIGFSLALAALLSWELYKEKVLPSSDPLIKLALTGDWGFSKPGVSAKEMVRELYSSMPFEKWVEIKKIMFQQAFMPIDHSITNTHLSLEFGYDAAGRLRAWDVLLLSKGNLLVPGFLVLLLVYSIYLAMRRQRERQVMLQPFFSMALISLVCWVILVLAFILPVVIPHIPQPALFGVLLAGAVASSFSPMLFRFLLLTQLAYTVLVWCIAPLKNALYIDGTAVVAMVLLAVWVFQLWGGTREVGRGFREG